MCRQRLQDSRIKPVVFAKNCKKASCFRIFLADVALPDTKKAMGQPIAFSKPF
jgi:hypothetical protein